MPAAIPTRPAASADLPVTTVTITVTDRGVFTDTRRTRLELVDLADEDWSLDLSDRGLASARRLMRIMNDGGDRYRLMVDGGWDARD